MPKQVNSHADYFKVLYHLGEAFSDAGIPTTPPWSRMILGIGTQTLVSRSIPEAVYKECVGLMLEVPRSEQLSNALPATVMSTDEPDDPIPYYDRITAALKAAGFDWTEADTATRVMHLGIMRLRRCLPEHRVRQATASAFAMAQVRRELMGNKPRKPAEKAS